MILRVLVDPSKACVKGEFCFESHRSLVVVRHPGVAPETNQVDFGEKTFLILCYVDL